MLQLKKCQRHCKKRQQLESDASDVKVRIKSREATQSPDGKHVTVACVCYSTGLIKHTLYSFLQECSHENNAQSKIATKHCMYVRTCFQSPLDSWRLMITYEIRM